MYWNIIKANAYITEMETDKLNLLKQIEDVKTELAAAQDVIGNFMKDTEGMDKAKAEVEANHIEAIKTLEEKYTKQITELTIALETEKKSANQKASEVLSTLGIEADTVKVATKPNDKELVGMWKTLTGTEQLKFYNQHREAILKELNLKK